MITLNFNLLADLAPILTRLDAIESQLVQLNERSMAMNVDLTNLTAEVSEISTVVDSAVTLIEGLAQQIRDAAGNQTALNELANQLDAKANQLAAAVAANTASAPDTPDTPDAEPQ